MSTTLPSMRSGARVPMRSEICVRLFTAPTSLVRRTRSCPVFCRSRLPNEYCWIFRNSASRRSRATPSPTRTEVMLFAIAKTVLTAEIPSIASAVRTTTPRSR